MRSPDAEIELTRLDRTLVAWLDVQDADSIRAAVDAGLARFEAGADAQQMLAGRRALDDAAFFAGMKAQFAPAA